MNVPRIETNPSGFADWDALHGLLRVCFAPMEGRITPPSSMTRMTQDDLRALAASGFFFVHRDRGGPPKACLFAAAAKDALYLNKLAVHPDLRDQGLARALIMTAATEAKRLGLPKLTLQTRVELTENHAAFHALGFSQTGTFSHSGFSRPTSLIFTRAV